MFDTRNRSWIKRAEVAKAPLAEMAVAVEAQAAGLPAGAPPQPPLDDYTYRDKHLSMWQSAANYVATSISPALLRAKQQTPQQVAEALMAPVHAVNHAAEAVKKKDQHFAATAPNFSALSTISECAKLSAELLWAELKGDHAAVKILEARLKYAVCNIPGWAECAAQYAYYKASQGSNPYRKGIDAVKPGLSDTAKIAIVGDWGTGDDTAISLLQQVKAQAPTMFIHLGDVYYAGTDMEMTQNFLQLCHSILGSDIPVYSLCGNHDMYSGGAPYYRMLDKIGQSASYFCLRGNSWQIVAVDTGNNDNNPLTVSTNMTTLNDTEIPWAQDKIHNSGGLKTILLSHHQLFSPFGSVGAVDGMPYCFNPNLYGIFKGLLSQIDLWIWGHEHTLAVYNGYMGLNRGRCVGCSAIPVFVQQQPYAANNSLHTFDGTLPTWQPAAQLGDDTIDYYHGFAMITLNGPNADVDYYQVPMVNPAALKLYSERI